MNHGYINCRSYYFQTAQSSAEQVSSLRENTFQVFSILSSRKRLIDTYIIGDDPVEAGDPRVPLQS